MISIRKGFIELNESGDIREIVLEGIADVENTHKLNKLTIDEIAEEIAQRNVLEDSLVSILAVISTSYAYFKHICKRASIEKLEELIEHPNYVVQCYAFVALTQKNTDKLFKIIMSKLHITEVIKTMGFDIGGRTKVADFFLYEGQPFLTEEQFHKVVEEVLENNYDLQFKSYYFLELNPKEKDYKMIRKFVTEYKNPYALVALAKFQKNVDLEIIKSFSHGELWQFNKAVQIFPHPSLLNPLLKIHNKGLERKETYPPNLESLYTALSVYHNIEALEVLTKTFDRIKNRDFVEYHAEAIFRAIRDFQDGFYDKLLFILWKDYNQINLEIFDYLWEKNSELSLETIKISVNNPDKFYQMIHNWDNFKDTTQGVEKLAEKMIRIFVREDKKNAFKAIKTNILLQNVNYLPVITKIVSKLSEVKDEFIEVLFNRFSNDKNYHVYCEIAKCLLDYNSSEINSKMLQIFKEKSYLRKNAELKEILKNEIR